MTNNTAPKPNCVHQPGTACVVCLLLLLGAPIPTAADIPKPLNELIRQTCLDCHSGNSAEGDLDLASLNFTLDDRKVRDRWILIHDRIHAGEMPPDPRDP